jgi:hypothetical protein
MNRAVIRGTVSVISRRREEPPMSDQSKSPTATGARRIQVSRRRPRREAFVDTTLTNSWPPRLNTAL